MWIEGLTAAWAVEDPASTSTIIPPPGIVGRVENPLPDLVGRIRFSRGSGHLQSAAFVGSSRFQPLMGSKDDEAVWGFNFTGSHSVTEVDTLKFQFAFGDGLSRFDGLGAVAPDLNGKLVATWATTWSVSYEHDWSDRWSSTFVYARPRHTPAPGETSTALRAVEYLAVNLVWFPFERTRAGVEYLFGSRTDKDGARGEANRIMFTVRYDLP